MKPLKTYYKGELVKTMFISPNPLVVDIHVNGKFVKDVPKKELMVSLVDAENEFKELEEKINRVKEVLGCEI